MKYRIISTDPENHSIVVRYYTDILTEDMLAAEFDYPIDGSPKTIRRLADGIPERCRTDYNYNIWNVRATKEDIEKYIIDSAPLEWFEMQHKILDPQTDTSLSQIEDLIGKEVDFDKERLVIPKEIEKPLTDEDIEILLNEIMKTQAT